MTRSDRTSDSGVSVSGILFLCLSGTGGLCQSLGQTGVSVLQPNLREFILAYDEVRTAKSPEETLLDFLQTTCEAVADLAK
jgi:hypothetical protein